MADGERVPTKIDVSVPSVARIYDYMLDGKDNYAADRAVADEALRMAPEGREAARSNRGFLRRVVHYLAAQRGVRQFVDIGSGLPTQGNVHEVAHEVDPRARVVYVDNDPIVLAHGRALLADNETTTVVQADLRRPDEIVDHPRIGGFIDFREPVGLLMFAIVHHINDEDDPAGIVARMRDHLSPGSHLAVSHFHNPGDEHPDVAREVLEVERLYNENVGTGRWRTRDEIRSYFGDFEPAEPGLVPLVEWRPSPDEHFDLGITYHTFLGGVAEKV